MLTTLVTPTKQVAEWARPRRQTDPNLIHRSSETLQPTDFGRRSIDWTPGSTAVSTSSVPSVTIVSPCSPLSIRGLSNPALAEIPLRKFNALRSSSTGSSDSSPSASASASASTPGSVLSTPTASVVAGPSSCELTALCPRDLTNHRDHNTSIQNNGQSHASSTADITTSPIAGPASKLGPNSNSPSPPKLHPSTSLTGFEARSLHHKRPPASRSSHGIETSTGPPPALSTQRTFLQDKVLRTLGGLQSNLARQFSQKSSAAAESENLLSPSIDAVLKGDISNKAATDRRGRQTSLLSRRGVVTKVNGKMSSTSTYPEASTVDGDEEPTVTVPNGLKVEENSRDSSADDNRTRGDDIFLNIARSNASNRESTGKADRRRKFGLSTRNSRASEQTPSPEQSRFNSGSASAFHTPGSSHNTLLFPLPASSHPLDESNRPRYFSISSGTRSTAGVPRGRLSRSAREMSPESPQTYTDLRPSPQDARTYRPSNLSASRTNPPPDATESSRLDGDRARLDGTESTLSTTAPSTVWDELDDLKSRIRKLELTGKLPSSSAAAMSNASAERPRTATTTVTTLSSSPKHDRKANTPSPDSDIGPGPGPTPVTAEASAPVPSLGTNQIETLLHSALAKVKTAVGTDAYNALEVTAADALTLANMLGSITSPSGALAAVNGVSLSERQARRKADSLCRGLTELCLALSDEQLNSNSKQQRPGSRDASSHVKTSNGSPGDSLVIPVTSRRSMSHEPEDSGRPDPSPRVASRLEARRTSLLSSGSRASQDAQSSPATAALPTPPTRLSRISASFRTKRRAEEDVDTKATAFSRVTPSRTMAEVGGFSTDQRYSPRERLSREYTPESQAQRPSSFSQKPLPQSRSPSVAPPSIPLRKSYGPSTSFLPATSLIQPGSRRYGASAAAAQATSDRSFNESRGERVESPHVPQPRIIAPSNKSVTGYSTVQQSRPRANNSGAHRIRLRQRATSTTKEEA